jgi:hypothetical protein
MRAVLTAAIFSTSPEREGAFLITFQRPCSTCFLTALTIG